MASAPEPTSAAGHASVLTNTSESKTAAGAANDAAGVADVRVARRMAGMERQIEETRMKLRDVEESLEKVKEELGSVDAEATVRSHIKLLHDYNEIRDIGTGLLGMIAERRGIRIKDVYEEFGLEEDD